jgi:enterochelin esterase-like enzyme
MKKRSALTMVLLFTSILFYAQNGTTYENQIFKSEILSKDVKYNIYLPLDYNKSKELPVLYYLHGFGGNHFSSSKFTKTIDSLISNHDFPEVIIISPHTEKTWYMDNADGTVKYSSMFIKEFIPFIKEKYAVTDDAKKTIIAGNSMGGFGAMRFSMLYPDIFGICIGFQAAIDTDYQFKNQAESDYQKFHEHIYGKKETKEAYINEFFYENQPLYMAQKLSTEELNKVKWYIQCCDNDYHSVPNAELHIVFRNKKVDHEYRVSNGKHSKKCVDNSFQDALGFLKKNLSDNLKVTD